jgi:hypothetical protein
MIFPTRLCLVGTEGYERIEAFSKQKADEMGLSDGEYFAMIYIHNSGTHVRDD